MDKTYITNQNRTFLVFKCDHSPHQLNENWNYNEYKRCWELVTPCWGKFRVPNKAEQYITGLEKPILIFVPTGGSYGMLFYSIEEAVNSIKAQR